MSTTNEPQELSTAFLAGGGEMGERIRSFDWSKTPLGPQSRWPQSLKTAVRIMLTSRQPIWIGWGPELIYLYNDPYKAIVGGRHPRALGQSVADVWPEIWDVIEPMLTTAMQGDEGTYVESQLLIMERHGYPEETYYTFSYSPVPDDDGTVGGIICANTDDTQRVMGERQLSLLRDLAAHTADARTWQTACERCAEALSKDPRDLPFAMLYLVPPHEPVATLAASTGIAAEHPALVESLNLADNPRSPIAMAMARAEFTVVERLEETYGAPFPSGSWVEPVELAVVIPIAASGGTGQACALMVGLSPLRDFDDSYRRFLELVAGQVAASLGTVQAYEEERKRTESLAKLDRAKTAFFSNVSHEFRTPLTLMLGPIEDLLERSHTELTPATKAELEVVHRNSLRLLKLVNTMLDFSRIEAGRIQARFEPTPLAELTAELASVFRAAVERAGVVLDVNCPSLAELVYVDRDMWEKIVLNLLSNAFKFTLEGEIRVELRASTDTVRLTVADTGVGIPENEVSRVFDRFHRVAESRGRTHEGTGIGLSLVQELVRLHGGSVRAQSQIGKGTQFIVEIPFGTAHLDPAQIISHASSVRSETVRADAFVQEALHWLPPEPQGPESERSWARNALSNLAEEPDTGSHAGALPRVLLADDNTDMRKYVARLLAPRFRVEAVPDGQAAFDAARSTPPDLILSDVMMPRLDGFGLLQMVRKDPELRHVPVILLSARASEEARVEGMEAGADDYLTKPFTARELLARVTAHVEMARARRRANRALREQEERLRLALETGRLGAWELDLATQGLSCSALCKEHFGLSPDDEISYARMFELIHSEDRSLVRAAIEDCVARCIDYDQEYRVVWPSDKSIHWLVARGQLLLGPDGTPTHLVGVTLDITERKRTEQELEASEKWFRMVADSAPAMLWITNQRAACTFLSRGWYEFTGQEEMEALGYGWIDAVHPDDRERSRQIFSDSNRERKPFAFDYRLRRADGIYRWAIDAGRPRYSEKGRFLGFIGSVIDVHERKEAEEALKAADRQKDEFLATLAHELRNPLAPLRSGLELMRVAHHDLELVERTRETMTRQVVHITRLVDDLLDVSRISRGEINLRKEQVALADIVREAVENASASSDKPKQVLSTTLPKEAIYVLGDPTRLLQILGNLLNNARKFTPQSGKIDIILEQQAGVAIIRIRDTGIGISAHELERIFDMFAQVETSEGGSEEGLGIGLTLVQRLVELHGGTVRASSMGLGRGSELTVTLPISEGDEASPSEETEVEKSVEAETRRILVVDDNRDAAEMLVALLELAGHVVQAAFDGRQAVEVAEEFRPEVILLDLGLPVLDGYQACRQMRAQSWGAPMKIVALTGWGQSEDRRMTKEAGFDEHLVKPVDPVALRDVLTGAPRA